MQQKRTIYRVKGIVRTSQMFAIWDTLADIEFEQTPSIKFTRTLQDKRCDKEIASGKRRHKRKGYGGKSYLLLTSTNHDDMVMAHERLERFFVPGSDGSKL